MLNLATVIGDCSHLRIYHRADRFIIFNPTIPAWVYSNATGAVVLKLASDGMPIGEVVRVAVGNGVSGASVEAFFEKCLSTRLFDIGEKSGRWANGAPAARRLESIYLHLTNKCNLSCSYCYRNSSPRISIKHFGEEFNAFLDDCADIASENAVLTFSGGEPMLHPDFWSVAEHAHAKGFTNHLLTNGTFIDAFNAPRLARLFDHIKISLDGASEAVHAQTRGTGNFEMVLNAIALLAQYDDEVKLDVQVTINAGNIADVAHVSQMLPASINMKYTPLMRMGRGIQTELDELIGNDQFHKISEQVDVQDGRGAARLRSGQRSFGCYAGDAHISVADNGDVYPCHLFHQNAFRMGNIFVDPIATIFRSAGMEEFAATMDVETNNPRCASCDFRYLCGGGCKANALHAFNDYRKSDTFCGFIRNTLLDDLFAGWSGSETGESLVGGDNTHLQ